MVVTPHNDYHFLGHYQILIKVGGSRVNVQAEKPRRLDSVSLGGIAVFGALAVVLTTLSHALGLNFPLIPYLQFDLGEIAILLAFFIFGPVPSLVAAMIEFVTLMILGQNAPIGPILKLISILASLGGIWLGMAMVARSRSPGFAKAAALGAFLGIVSRVVFLTIANYYLLVFFGGEYAISGLIPYLAGFFKLVGIGLTSANGLSVILLFTAVFNALQLLFVAGVTYFLVSLPQVQATRAAGRRLWVISYLRSQPRPPAA
jgi:riboflavin transporter FmnP